MKFSVSSASTIASTLLGLSSLALASTSTSELGQCISGKGEFTFRGAVDAHFDLEACKEDADSHIASGLVKSGQFNKDGDVFYYDVHCMSVHPDGNTVFVGAEINELSKYVATYQDPHEFRKSLVNGNRDMVIAYERKVYQHHAGDPGYIEALTGFLESRGHTIQSYEEGIGLRDEGSSRRLKRGKANKENAVPLQVVECAGKLIDGKLIDKGCSTESLDEPTSDLPYSFDLDSFSLDSTDEAEALTSLTLMCATVSFFTCAYTPEDFGGFGFELGGRRLLEQKSNDVQGTLALFQLSLDGDHSIAVKLGHEFDTTCVDFAETIDHGYFTDETVDNLKDGEFSLN